MQVCLPVRSVDGPSFDAARVPGYFRALAYTPSMSRSRYFPFGLGLALSVWAGLWTYALFPGEGTIDTVLQYEQGRSFTFTNAHPVLYSLLLGLSHAWLASPGLVVALQLCGGALALWVVGVRGVPARLLPRLTFLMLAFCPLLWAQWAALWKDEALTVAYVGALAALVARRQVLAIGLLLLAAAFRHNGVTLVAPLFVYAAAQFRTRLGTVRTAALAAALCVAAVLTPRLLERAMGATDARPAVPSLVFDIAGVYLRSRPAFDSGPYSRSWKLGSVRRRYAPRTARKLTSDRGGLVGLRHKDFLTDRRYLQLRKEWTRVVRRYPEQYLEHRWAVSCSYFNVCDPKPFEPYAGPQPRLRKRIASPDRQTPAYRYVDAMRAETRPMAVGWPWSALVLLFGLLALVRRAWLDVAITASVLLYQLGNLVAAPSTPFRYHLPVVVALIVLLPRGLSRADVAPARSAAQ